MIVSMLLLYWGIALVLLLLPLAILGKAHENWLPIVRVTLWNLMIRVHLVISVFHRSRVYWLRI